MQKRPVLRHPAVVCPCPPGADGTAGRLLGPEIPIGLGDELLQAAGAAEHLRGPGMLDAVRRILGHHHATDRIAHRPILVRAARAVRAVIMPLAGAVLSLVLAS